MKYGTRNLNWFASVIDKLGGEEVAERFLAGNVEVVIKDHIINCGADPFVPDGWKVQSHQKMGDLILARSDERLFLDGKEIKFFLSEKQKKGSQVGNDLCDDLTRRPVLNANVLDYLLAHPDLIPDSWKVDEQGRTRCLFFWGTIYRSSGGSLCVRCLCWGGGRWCWGGYWLGIDFSVSSPAAVLAS